MENMLDFIVDYYILFLVLTIILIFALIGYFVENKRSERFTKDVTVDSDFSQKMEVAKTVNISMNDMVNDSSKRVPINQPAPNAVQAQPTPVQVQPANNGQNVT